MNNAPVSFSALVKALVCGLVIVVVLVVVRSKPVDRMVFCDVGQGDGTYIRLANGFDMVIDGGSRDMLECLGRYMPFYDKHIDLIFVTHPHLDHYGGLRDVVRVFQVEKVIVPAVTTESTTYNQFLKLAEERSHIYYISEPLRIQLSSDSHMLILWPTANFIAKKSSTVQQKLPVSSYDPNAFSLVQVFKTRNSQVLFTGDIPFEILEELVSSGNLGTIDVLKVSHHGSHDGTSHKIIEELKPGTAILSYGNPNRYQHPSRETAQLLEQAGVTYYATADHGNIHMIHDAQGWRLAQSCFVFLSC